MNRRGLSRSTFAAALAAAALVGAAGFSRAARADDVAASATVAAAEAAWRAKPADVALALAWQDALLAAGKRSQAIDAARRRVDASGSGPLDALLLGRAQGGARGAAAMRAALERGLGGASEDDLARGWRALVAVEDREGLADDAARDAATLAARTGAASDHAVAGRWREKTGDDAGARAAYEAAIAKDGRCRAARYGLTALLARTGDAAGAVRVARETIAAYPQEPWAQVHLGIALAAAGRGTESRQAYVAALLKAGDDVALLTALGATFTGIEDFATAHKALDRAVELAPRDPSALSAAGVLALEEGKPVAAQGLFARAAEVAPSDPRVAFLLGVSAERRSSPSEAVEAYQRAVKLAPQKREYATALALALESTGDTEGAIAAFKTAMDLAPKDAALRVRLGGLYEAKKKWRLAEEQYRAAADLSPKDPNPHLFLAVIYGDHLQKRTDARDELRLYASLGGKEPAALRWLEELEGTKGK